MKNGVQTPRMRRERKTIVVMIEMFCKAKHAIPPSSGIKNQESGIAVCKDCLKIADYASARLDACPFSGEAKPTCVKCPVHCYNPEMKEKTRVIMRYAGPRMIFKHPVLAVLHLIDGKHR